VPGASFIKLARIAVASGAGLEPQLPEAPVWPKGWVGLGVHAHDRRGVSDAGSGELRTAAGAAAATRRWRWAEAAARHRCGS
jgi:hypothetical protein